MNKQREGRCPRPMVGDVGEKEGWESSSGKREINRLKKSSYSHISDFKINPRKLSRERTNKGNQNRKRWRVHNKKVKKRPNVVAKKGSTVKICNLKKGKETCGRGRKKWEGSREQG